MRLGGTVAYAGCTAAALGREVGIVTSVGPAAALSPLEMCATIVSRPAPQTTTFENVYTEDGERRQFAYALAHPLGVADLPAAWQRVPVAHIGPIMDECDPGLVEHFAGRAFVGLTPQGWMRARDSAGRVHSKRWETAERLLPLASAVVLSLEDVGGDWAVIQSFARQTAILVITRGWLGGVLFLNGVAHTFPAFEAEEVNATGAGDIFATAFFVALTRELPPLEAVTFAACVAADSVRREGLDSAPGPGTIAACTAQTIERR
ncbi:MAG: PfkB family carbohydrate kinase [Anaerolineales bacterium]